MSFRWYGNSAWTINRDELWEFLPEEMGNLQFFLNTTHVDIEEVARNIEENEGTFNDNILETMLVELIKKVKSKFKEITGGLELEFACMPTESDGDIQPGFYATVTGMTEFTPAGLAMIKDHPGLVVFSNWVTGG